MAEKQLCFFLAIVVVIFSLAAGLEWTKSSASPLHVTGCVGSEVTLPWDFKTEAGETIDKIRWTHGAEDAQIASIWISREGQFQRKGAIANRLQRSQQYKAGIVIENAELADTGYYVVRITVWRKNSQGQQSEEEISAVALLTVAQAPALSGAALDVQEMTSDDTCALKRHVTLSCGSFESRGFPPVDVVWTDPAGQLLNSSDFDDGQFLLELPRRPLPGNYTCRLTCQSPVLKCLPPSSPLRSSKQVQVRDASTEGCGDLTDRIGDLTGQPAGARSEQDFEELVQNVTQLQQALTSREDRDQQRTISFEAQVQELRELVITSMQQSQGAKMFALEELTNTLKQATDNLQKTVTELQRDKEALERRVSDMQTEHSQELDELRRELNAIEQTSNENENEVTSLSADLEQSKNAIETLKSKFVKLDDKVTSSQITQKTQSQKIDAFRGDLDRVESDCNATIEVVRSEVSDSLQDGQLARDVQEISVQLGVVERSYTQLAEQVETQCQFNASDVDLSFLEERLLRVENEVALPLGDEAWQIGSDPLVSKLQPTFSMTPPQGSQIQSIIDDFVITPRGDVVIADKHQSNVIISRNASSSDVIKQPLKYGRHMRALTYLDDGIVAATVDDNYIYILDTTTNDPVKRERWVKTQNRYQGIAARSDLTLYVGAVSSEAGGEARIDVITISGDRAEVLKTLMNQTTTKELQNPFSLTVHDDNLYVCDWDSNNVLRLSLDTHDVTVMAGPGANPQRSFFQPRQTAFDVSGNMYVTTGGEVCQTGSHLYSQGFCLVVISRDGGWRRLVAGGKHVYPYGVTLTPTGLVLSWVSWAQPPSVRSQLQWYNLVQPKA